MLKLPTISCLSNVISCKILNAIHFIFSYLTSGLKICWASMGTPTPFSSYPGPQSVSYLSLPLGIKQLDIISNLHPKVPLPRPSQMVSVKFITKQLINFILICFFRKTHFLNLISSSLSAVMLYLMLFIPSFDG